MDEHVEIQIGARLPERAQRLGIEALVLQLRGNDHARKAQLDSAALEFGGGFGAFERRHMRQTDEAAGMGLLCLTHAIVDGAADGKIGLVEARSARQHAGVDTGGVHHPHMRRKIGQQRVEQIMRIAVAIEIDRDFTGIALEQFRWGVVLLKVDEHGSP